MRILLAAALLVVAVPAVAQTHEHATGSDGEHLVILHDGPTSGRAVVGSLTHFGFALVSEHGRPVRHHDAAVTLAQNGVVLFSSEATHEYDGIFSLDVTFEVPGPYTIEATSDTGAKAFFNGTAVSPVAPRETRTTLTLPEDAMALAPAAFGIAVEAANGTLVDHSDVVFEARRVSDGLLVFRNHFHTHDAPIAFDLAFPTEGEYFVRALGYNAFPTGRLGDYETTIAEERITVAPPAASGLRLPALALPAPAPASASGARDEGHAGAAYVLTLTADPENRTGMLNHERLSAFVWDVEAQEALQHVNFQGELLAADGTVVFSSESLHEYDGHLEAVFGGLLPGLFTWRVTAEYDEWTDSAELPIVILPPVVPGGVGGIPGVGPLTTTVDGLDGVAAGVPAELTFAVRNAAGLPVSHSEIEFAFLRLVGDVMKAPTLHAKVHTHMDAPKATVTFPTAGEYIVILDGDTLFASPTTYDGEAGPTSQATILSVTVAEGPGLPRLADEVLPAGTEEPRFAPTVGIVATALAAVALALVARRR